MALITDLAEVVATWAEEVVAPILDPAPEAEIVYGDVAIDECCPFDLIVAVGQITPLTFTGPRDCAQPWGLSITVIVSGCVSTMNEQGHPIDAWADMVPVVDAGQALWESVCALDAGDDWLIQRVTLTPLGASGGCVSSVLTITAWVN